METLYTVLAIVACVLLFSVAIFIHEFGHFIFAKTFKVYCLEFSIGMGPAIVSKKFKKDKEIKKQDNTILDIQQKLENAKQQLAEKNKIIENLQGNFITQTESYNQLKANYESLYNKYTSACGTIGSPQRENIQLSMQLKDAQQTSQQEQLQTEN